MLHVVVNLFAYVRGCATNVEMELEAEQDTRLTEDEWAGIAPARSPNKTEDPLLLVLRSALLPKA